MASDGLTNREQTGPLLDIRSERLYDLTPDIPNVMGLRALRPNAAILKVMSVRDSQCIRVVTPDDHVERRFSRNLASRYGRRGVAVLGDK